MKKIILACLFLFSCAEKGPNIPPVQNFEIDKYLGEWYEIARTDNAFERGCTDVKAVYTMRDKSGINVLNSCVIKGKKREAKGIAHFKGAKNVGELKVSFFRPFYGTYRVIYVDKNYQNAIVYGGSPKYIWILSRTRDMDTLVLRKLFDKVKGFNLDEKSLIIEK